MKRLISILIAIFSITLASAQNELDALRFSQNFYSGTARFNSMGGAFSAIGGDISCLSINPAGLAIFRHNEFSITPSFTKTNIDSKFTLDKNSETDFKYSFGLDNIGFVSSINTGNDDDWAYISFGIGYNKLNDFNSNSVIGGVNTTSSRVDDFAYRANIYNADPSELDSYESMMAYDGYLISGTKNNYKSMAPYVPVYDNNGNIVGETINLTQKRTLETKGSIGEYNFAFAANYAHKIYLGVSFGIQSLRYNYTSVYSEHNNDTQTQSDTTFRDFTFREEGKTRGTGFNVKVGLIARPLEWVRVGLAVTTPTFYSLTREYTSKLNSYFDYPDNNGKSSYYLTPISYDSNGNSYDLDNEVYDYSLTTPTKVNTGIALFIKKVATLSFDYEYVSYKKARLRAKEDDFSDVNDIISNNFNSTSNFRVGLDYRFGPVSLRGGYMYYGSPYKDSEDRKPFIRSSICGGIGINNNDFYLDISVVQSNYENTEYIYTNPENTPLVGADLKNSSTKFLATIGFRF